MRTQQKYETPFHYWISFFPAAPLFGVQWRFETMMPGASWFRPGKVAADMARASAKEAAQATEEAVAQVVRAAEEAVSHAAEAVEVMAQNVDAAFHMADAAPPAEPAKPAGLLAERPAVVDDLKQIKGVGPKLEEQLNALGIWTYAQIAGFSEADLLWLDQNLATAKGRPMRDDWVGQARALL